MTLMILLGVFLLAGCITFVAAYLFDRRRAQSRLLRNRLANIQQAPTTTVTEELELLRDDVLSEIPALDRLLRSSKRITVLQEFLDQANLAWKAGNFLIVCGMTAVFLLLVVYVTLESWLLGSLGAVLGLVLPYAYVSFRRTRRFNKFEAIFPEALDTLARAVRAGHAFTTAIELLSTETSQPVAGEFRKLFEEQKYGLPVRDALLNMTRRVPLIDVKFFVTAVMLQRETGGNFAEILDNLSYVIRERFKVLRQVKVHTAQGRMTMLVLMAIPPAVIVGMLSIAPDFVRPLFNDRIGQLLLMIAGCLQLLGYILIRKVVRIQV